MNINEIRIYRDDDNEVLKGFANITLNNAISIKGLKIINTDKKRFVVMPSYVFKGVLQNIAFPINQKTRNELEEKILSLYDEMIDKNLLFIDRKYVTDKLLSINHIKVDNHDFRNHTKAVFDIVINEEYVLKGIKLLFKNDHYFMVMPNHLVKDKYLDYYHPIDKDTREHIENLLINIYEKSKEGITSFTNNSQKDIFKTSVLDFVYL